MIKRCIMIFPKFDNMNRINELRREFDPLYNFVPPHITLVFPFESEITTIELKEHLHKVITGCKEFNLELQGISGGSGNYLFLDVTQGNDFIKELQKRIYTGILVKYIPSFLDITQYIPHLTVGRVVDQTEYNAALNKCNSNVDIFRDVIKHISVEIIDVNENSIIELTVNMQVLGIIDDLHHMGVIDKTDNAFDIMTGTTDGLVYTLAIDQKPQYILKLDHPQQISLVDLLLTTYPHTTLLPKLLYTDPEKEFIVYSYITGTTHHNRGLKITWLTLLVNELINQYEIYPNTDKWGFWLKEPCQTWREFIDRGVEHARIDIGNLLSTEDYQFIKQFVINIPEGKLEDRYLLHGDCGVHNFVFNNFSLTGVIDPYPIIGPPLYDFMYAFCSSPDDLNLETLIQAFDLLKYKDIERSSLIEQVTIQLYCRIGTCIRHHPDDLDEYLKAWDYWKALVI